MLISDKMVGENNKYWYTITIDIDNDAVTIMKKWDTGSDPRDSVVATLTFRKEEFSAIVQKINELIIKSIKKE